MYVELMLLDPKIDPRPLYVAHKAFEPIKHRHNLKIPRPPLHFALLHTVGLKYEAGSRRTKPFNCCDVYSIATTVTFIGLTNGGADKSPPSFIDAIFALVVLSVFVSAGFAVFFILGKAAEMRYKPSELKTLNFLVKHKPFFYNAAVTIYIPIIQLIGWLLLIGYVYKYLSSESTPAWVQISIPLIYFAFMFARAAIHDSKRHR